ncbi:MAG TPA: phosphotransferase family protein [Xanthomonadales bacterium]|nr:phosphotransferase family protein [Xanthomonadales bacterium]
MPAKPDDTRLCLYLEDKLDDFSGPLTLRKFPGGQSNPTFLVEAGKRRYVLRRKPEGPVLKSAHAVDREFRVISALAATNIPVARALHLCTDESVIGSMFYLMSYVDGRTFWDAALPELQASERPAVYSALITTLADLHAVDIEAAGLQDYGKPGNYFERQISLWTRQYELSQTGEIAAMNELMESLSRALPADDGRLSLIHGDFRIDNLIFHREQPRVLALIDWELSTLGHPMADLAYFSMSLRLPRLSEMKGLGGKNRAELNIPDEDELIAQYCQRSGLSGIRNWPFYLAFSYFRLAAIVQGVAKRALEGNASSQKAAEVGKMTEPLATMGLDALEI